VTDESTSRVPDIASRGTTRVDLLLRNATTTTNRRLDVAVADGAISAVAPAGTLVPGPTASVVDLDGYILLPAPVEPHTHLDKALTWHLLATGHVGLPDAIESWSEASRRLDVTETRDRAVRAVAELVEHGATSVRTHVDVCPGDHPLAAVEALIHAREGVADVLDLQVTFFSRPETPDDVIRAAVGAGADIIGGGPYMGVNALADNARLLRLAAELDVDVDLHVDEELDPSVATLGDLARRVLDGGFSRAVTASHCVSLGVQDSALVAEVVAVVAEAGLRVITLPLTNLYLMGRGWDGSPPRGLTLIRRFLDAGVTVAAGSDNIRDPFNPMGRADPLALASLLVSVAHLTVTEAYDTVSTAARQVMGLPDVRVEVGSPADLLAVRALSLDEALARNPDDRIVIGRGRVLATTQTRRQSAFADDHTLSYTK
jgi:cytosine deaminase